MSRAASERAEPSLAVLATLIQEIGFAHAVRIVDFVHTGLSAPADDTIDAVMPLVEGHPYQKYLDALRDDRTTAANAIKELAASIDTGELELTEILMLLALGQSKRTHPYESTFKSIPIVRSDPVFRELARLAYFRDGMSKSEQFRQLSTVSPHAPAAARAQISLAILDDEPQAVADRAAEWEQRFSEDHSVLGVLVTLYDKLGRDDDALRVAKRDAEVSAELDAYRQLAARYKKRGNIAEWKATLDAFLKLETLGLEQSVVQGEIANHFIQEKNFTEALPYVSAAAGTGSSLGLMIAHRYYSGLKDWRKAELYVRLTGERYPSLAFEWFFWCKRTGRGDVETARRLAEAYFTSLGSALPQDELPFLAVFRQLAGDAPAAFETWSECFKKSGDPLHGLNAALIAHDLGDAASRDQLLEQVTTRGKSFLIENRVRVELIKFGTLLQQQIAAGSAASFDETNLEELLKNAPPGERTGFHYFAGRILLREGRTADAHKHLMQAATAPNLGLSRTLAATLLLEQGVELEEIRVQE